MKDALAQRRYRVTFGCWEGTQLGGLVSAHARRGYRVWEVDRLFISAGPLPYWANGHRTGNGVALELLEQVVEGVGTRRGERILLRLPANSPIDLLARRAGFFPYFDELILEGPGGWLGPEAEATPAAAGLVERLPQDDYPLFQLYSAATPQAVRAGMGLTFDQWRDAQEPRNRGRREWVVRNSGRITGWLGLSRNHRGKELEVLAHPAYPGLWRELVEPALAQGGLQRWVVPDYQELTTDILLGHGFHETSRFTMLIKTVVVPVLGLGMAPVEA